MDPTTITLDRESFKALASEVRVEILKQLDDHRQTVTDLSKSLSLAKPTLLEHLDRLVSANLIVKKDEGRKWIYYELTRRGRHILRPHQVKIMISLALSFLLFSAGIVAVMAAGTTGTFTGGPTTTQTGESLDFGFLERGLEIVSESPSSALGLVLIAVAAALAGLGIALFLFQRSFLKSGRVAEALV